MRFLDGGACLRPRPARYLAQIPKRIAFLLDNRTPAFPWRRSSPFVWCEPGQASVGLYPRFTFLPLQTPIRSPASQSLLMSRKILYALGLLIFFVVGGIAGRQLFPLADSGDSPPVPSSTTDASKGGASGRDPAADSPGQSAGGQPTQSLTLTAEQLATAHIQLATATRMPLQAHHTLPGRLDYDQERHVAIKSACDGILTEIQVHPGDAVVAGQTVAIVSSPAVGAARAAVKTQIAQWELADRENQWRQAMCRGVEKLANLIRQRQTPQEISAALSEDALGEFREKIVSAYTRARLADQLVTSTRPAADQGAIAASVQQQRESEWEAAQAALAAVLEQSLFEVRQQCAAALAAAAQADRMVDLRLQELNSLLGLSSATVTRENFQPPEDHRLSDVPLLAPIAGTIEERLLSVGERIAAGEAVIVVADVSALWAVADVREHDWPAMAVEVGQQVEVTSPALGQERFTGQVLIVGRRIDPTSGAASLIARLQATDPRLRPGLFIRMTLPTSPPRSVLAVPEQSVVVHEGQPFVFVARDHGQFQRVDVAIGETQAGWTEIVSGLEAGTAVAASGVFQLKSQLLLASEEE